MRARLTLDHDLVHSAQEYTGITDNNALVREALKSLVERGELSQAGRAGRYDAGPGGHSTQAFAHAARIARVIP